MDGALTAQPIAPTVPPVRKHVGDIIQAIRKVADHYRR